MSRATRAATRRAQRAFAPDAQVATLTGWCAAEEDLDDCRHLLHDQLIEQLGTRRRGPVQWTWSTGPSAIEQIEVLLAPIDGEPASLELSDLYRQILGLLREFGGFVVTAMAEAVPA